MSASRDPDRSHSSTEPTLPLPGSGSASRRDTRRRIGSYRLVEVLGEGGMGVVFLAEQEEPIRRQVAIKVIRSQNPDPLGIHRFEAERHALARMSHPHIAQVFEAGDTPEGEPYVVMEYVPGVPITDFCDHRRLRLDERLDLFQRVCEGVHHAHQKGVLHRDLKPANVLVIEVDGRPMPKIIDFGIALALEHRSELPETALSGVLLGTPSYLSPEAIASPRTGDLDIRADVYALGIVLFELLVGERPFVRRSRSYDQLIERIRHEETPVPSRRWRRLDAAESARRAVSRGLSPDALARRLRSDLDWITARAMDRDRERRYGSVTELREDIERYRRHEPVRAAPTHRLYQTRKLLRRHRKTLAVAALLAITLVGGVVARTLEAGRANREAARASREASAAAEVSDFLIDLFQVSDPEAGSGATVTARELLDRGSAQIRRELEDQPLTRARLMATIGRVYRQLGLFDQAHPLLEEALELRTEHLGTEAPERVSSLLALAVLHWEQGQLEPAEGLLVEALDARRRIAGTDSPTLAEVLGRLGSLRKSQGRFEQAETLHLEALERLEAGDDPPPEAIADALDDLGTLYVDWGRFEVAEERLRRALEIRERRFGPDHALVATTLNGLAIAVAQQGELERAVEMFRRALAIREDRLGPAHPQVAQSLNNLASALQSLDRPEEAEPLLRRAVAVWERALGEDNVRVGVAVNNLADFFFHQGQDEEAEAWFLRALDLFERHLPAGHPSLAYPINGLADLRKRQGRLAEAEALYERALAIRQEALEPDHPALEATRDAYAELLHRDGRTAEAESLGASPR